MSTPLHAFASIAPGLEPMLMEELRMLDLRPQAAPGGATFRTDLAGIWRVHLFSRLAGRVSVEIGTIQTSSLGQLAGTLKKLDWTRWVWRGQPVRVEVHGARTRRDSVAKKAENAIRDALRGPRLPGPRPPREEARVDVILKKKTGTVHIDASGELLHRRGWRKATAKAPIRENLGAALLWASGWEPGTPLVDPMCGSGTLVIEAAGIAMGHAPGAHRDFAFERWPIHDAKAYGALLHHARQPVWIDENTPIVGNDRAEGAIRATRSNAQRAHVHHRIQLHEGPFRELEPPTEPGVLVVNPPYGRRVKGRPISSLGQVLAERWSGWRYALLLPDKRQLRQLPGTAEVLADFSNGGIRVSIATGRVP